MFILITWILRGVFFVFFRLSLTTCRIPDHRLEPGPQGSIAIGPPEKPFGYMYSGFLRVLL